MNRSRYIHEVPRKKRRLTNVLFVLLFTAALLAGCTIKLTHTPSGSKFYVPPNPFKVAVLTLDNKTDGEYRDLWSKGGTWGFDEEPHIGLSRIIYDEVKSLGLFQSVERVEMASGSLQENIDKFKKENACDVALVGELYEYKAGGAPHAWGFITPTSLLWIPGLPVFPGFQRTHLSYDLRLVDLHTKRVLWSSGKKTVHYNNDLTFSSWTTDPAYWKEQNLRLAKNFIEEVSNNLVEASTKNQIMAMYRGPSPPPAESVETPAIKSDIDEIPQAAVKRNSKAYAIVIGIDTYRRKLPRADFAVSDAKLVSAYLSRVMGYPEENVVTLLNENASYVDMAKYFEQWLANNVEKGGTVFVYYSGHGAPNPKTGDAYLVPYDGDPAFIEKTGYPLKRLYEALGKLPAREIIVALDACFSGAGGRSVIAEGSRPLVVNYDASHTVPGNMTVLAAASGSQISSTYKEKGHGLFSYFFLKGIKNEDVVKQDGSLSVSDLFLYLKPQVERVARRQYNNEQTPQIIESK